MLQLRDYQQECVDIIDKLPDGSKTVVAIATGLGKTATAAHIPFHGRLLWLSHRDELVRQPEKYFSEQGYSYGIEKADEHENGEEVVSASIQSISRDNRLKKFDPKAFDIIVCDEAHHAAAPTYKKVLSYFQPRKLIGLTATPQRGDKVRLDDVFDSICFARDLRWGIENGYLSRIRCLRVQASYDMDKLEKVNGDYSAASVSNALSDSDDDMVVTKAYLEHCLPEKRQTIIYCPTIKVCKLIRDMLVLSLPDEEKDTVRLLSQECSQEERHEILDGFREKRYHCIVNCMILTEGADLPETSAIINNRPSVNSSLYQQIIGRGTRLADGKDYCLIIDVIGKNGKTHELCTAPTLFGLDPNALPKKMLEQMQEEDLLDFAIAASLERAKSAKQLQLAIEMVDLFAQQKLEHIRNNWVENDARSAQNIADSYRKELELPISGYDFGDIIVKLQPNDARHFFIQPTFNGAIYLSKPDMLGKTILDVRIPECTLYFISPPIPLEEAVSLTSNILNYIVPDYYAQKWSKSARIALAASACTEKQASKAEFEFRKFGNEIRAGRLNKLQASDLIDLMTEIRGLESERSALVKDDEPKNKNTKKYQRWLEKKTREENAAKSLEQSLKENWEGACRVIQEKAIRGKARKLEAEKREEKMLSGAINSLTLTMDYRFFRKDPEPSYKQLDFLSSLFSDVTRRGIVFDADPTKQKLDMWHTGFLINLLLQIRDRGQLVKGKRTKYLIAPFVEQIKKIKSPENAPATIEYHFELID